MEERSVTVGLEGTSQNQWSKQAKPRARAEVTGSWSACNRPTTCLYSPRRGHLPISWKLLM